MFILLFAEGCRNDVSADIGAEIDNSTIGLVVSPQRVDAGIVEPGRIASAQVTISNPTDTLVEILDVRTSCGCTIAKVENRRIPAKGSTSIDIRIQGIQQAGDFAGSIEVATSMKNGTFQIPYSAHFLKEVEFARSIVDLQQARVGVPITLDLYIRVHGDYDIKCIADLSDDNNLNIEVVSVVENASMSKCVVKLTPTRIGLDYGNITCHAISSSGTVVSSDLCRIKVRGVGDYWVKPDKIFFIDDLSKEKSLFVEVGASSDAVPVALKEVTSDAPFIQLRRNDLGKDFDKGFWIDFLKPSEMSPALLRTEIQLTLDVGSHSQSVRIPVLYKPMQESSELRATATGP
ncbi:DUF1573 domain-containing protein [Bremerella sp.]|uniref:DUF1573 domain-containing protein n=1 Tax=Bremerella sp. TaxID=2795602 RepID=UPI00391C89B0